MDYYIILIISIILSYLVGSIPFALIIGKLFYKIDVRDYGSHNLGTTNVGRVLGKFPALIVLIFDASKGGLISLIMYYISYHFLSNIDYSLIIFLLCGIFSCIGHCFPVFASFKGGKAVATFFGFLAFLNYKLFLVFLITFLIVAFISKIISLASIFASIITTLCSLLLSLIPFKYFNYPYLETKYSFLFTFFTLVIMSLILIYRHKANINRLVNHQEKKFSFYKK